MQCSPCGPPPPPSSARPTTWTRWRRLAHGDGLFLIADADGRIVGTLIGGWDGWRAGLYRLAVHPEWRRQGIATRLISEVETRLQRLGAQRISLRVFHESPGAVELWSSAGYVPLPEESVFAKNLPQPPEAR